MTLCAAIAGVNRMPLPAAAGQGLPRARRVRAALQRELPASEQRVVVRLMWKELLRARCLPAKLERAIDCMRLIAGRTAQP
jgi:hypothetical protein